MSPARATWPRNGVTAATVAVVAAGGMLGSLARYGIGQLWTSPWAIVAINIVGSLLLGLLMGRLSRGSASRGIRHPLLRPFIGIGVLGGFTTFSTAMVDLRVQLGLGHWPVALELMLATTFGSLAAAGAGWRVASMGPG